MLSGRPWGAAPSPIADAGKRRGVGNRRQSATFLKIVTFYIDNLRLH